MFIEQLKFRHSLRDGPSFGLGHPSIECIHYQVRQSALFELIDFEPFHYEYKQKQTTNIGHMTIFTLFSCVDCTSAEVCNKHMFTTFFFCFGF